MRKRKSDRKIYSHGDKLTIEIPSYLDQSALDWLNSQNAIATTIWDLIIKAAKSELNNVNGADIAAILKLLALKTNDLNSLISSVPPDKSRQHEQSNDNSNQTPKLSVKNASDKKLAQDNETVKMEKVVISESIGGSVKDERTMDINLSDELINPVPDVSKGDSGISPIEESDDGKSNFSTVEESSASRDESDVDLKRSDGHINLNALTGKGNSPMQKLNSNKRNNLLNGLTD